MDEETRPLGLLIARQEEAIRSLQADLARLHAVIRKAADVPYTEFIQRHVYRRVMDDLRAALPVEPRALPEGDEG